MGLGYQRAEEEFDAFPSVASPGQREDGNLAAKFGVGLQSDLGSVGIRTELAYRADFDDTSMNGAVDEDWFGDVLASVGVVIPLGPEPMAPAPPAPAPNCADSDDDGDGVNNCDDKCPGSQAGQTIGPDGCPVPVSIDLKGVNFDFDKSTLRPDAVAILNEAAEILKRYPELKVEVAGHTDSSRFGRLQPGSVGASRPRRVRLPDQQWRGCFADVRPERLRREPPDRSEHQRRRFGQSGRPCAQSPHRAERPELSDTRRLSGAATQDRKPGLVPGFFFCMSRSRNCALFDRGGGAYTGCGLQIAERVTHVPCPGRIDVACSWRPPRKRRPAIVRPSP